MQNNNHTGYWDIHNHILPGLDDGSPTPEESMEMIAEEYSQGVRNIIFTPHYRPGMFPVTADIREKVFLDFAERAQQRYPDMRFMLGCELHVQKGYSECLPDARCRMAGTFAVLLEFSTGAEYSEILEHLIKTAEKGYFPIIAHAERCTSLRSKPQNVIALRKEGALIQINAETLLAGRFSPFTRFAKKLLTQNAVDFIASDAHDMSARPVLIEEAIKTVIKDFGEERAEQIFRVNPEEGFGN